MEKIQGISNKGAPEKAGPFDCRKPWFAQGYSSRDFRRASYIHAKLHMQPEDVPPWIKPKYTHQARRSGFEGRVRLKVLISSKGRVKYAKVISVRDMNGKNIHCTGLGLEKEALKTLFQKKYKPTLLHREAVNVMTVYPVRYKLN